MFKRIRPVTVFAAILALLALSLAVAGCGDEEKSGGTSAPEVSDAWARTTAEAAKSGAIYMKIAGGGTADRLVAAKVDESIAGETQIHEVVAKDAMGEEGMDGEGMDGAMGSGEMVMREVDAIEIPADGSVELKPGGYHVMLLDLKKQIKEGDKISVTLTFEQGGEVTVEATARTATDAAGAMHDSAGGKTEGM